MGGTVEQPGIAGQVQHPLADVPGEPGIDTLRGRFVHSDVPRTGSFRCSNDLVNRIHRNILWGQLSNLMSIPTDCPQRDERHGWLGDAHLSAEEAILNFDMAAFYTKYLEDIRFAQKEDGSLPDVVPAYMPRLYPADPAWSSAYAILVWLMYLYYGDTRVIERHYLPLKRYIEFLGRNAENHINRKLGKYGDWCPPGSIVPKKTPVELTSTWYYYHDVGLVAAMVLVPMACFGRTRSMRGNSEVRWKSASAAVRMPGAIAPPR
jgi:alpha-L-rhamnosidase